MTSGHSNRAGIFVVIRALAPILMPILITIAAAAAWPQATTPLGNTTLLGHVSDSSGKVVVNATVSLQPLSEAQAAVMPVQTTQTDGEGAYGFAALRAGLYTLNAKLKGSGEAAVSPVNLAEKETRTIDLVLAPPKASQQSHGQPPQFFDEPQFTVAGVTQASNSGGHGSDTVLRTTEKLAKATVALGKESPEGSTTKASATTEASLRDALAHDPESFVANKQLARFLADSGQPKAAAPFLEKAENLNSRDPDLHHLLADINEKLGNPLEAVREYQRAAELDPTEPNLFDWGTELLTHGAPEPATEVFTKGNRLFPKSVRMLVALAVARYSLGSYEEAAQSLAGASDLDPGNPTPYLFLGRMQSVEGEPSQSTVEQLHRFAQLQPDSALANYYYAVGLWKRLGSAVESDRTELSGRVESLLQKAVRLDPKFGPAYLQLGILYSQQADLSHAISVYQKAIEHGLDDDETLEKAHYRLAQLYQRTGEKVKAQQELEFYATSSNKTKDKEASERNDIQQFVISLRTKYSVPQSPDH